MSKLSERCKQHLEENGYTIYSFSKAFHLDRTSVHRLVNGKRLPSKDFITSFCKSLRINAKDETEIFELYEEEKVGSLVYQNRKSIINFLNTVHMIESLDYLASPPEVTALSPFTDTAQSTKKQIRMLLISIFQSDRENPCILTNFPPTSAFSITTILGNLYGSYRKNVLFKHLLTLSSNPSSLPGPNSNLEQMMQILPLALSNFCTYMPYYTYSHSRDQRFPFVPCPYYIMTEDMVLEISSDLKRSILHTDPTHVRVYRQELTRIFNDARPMMQISHDLASAWELYSAMSCPTQPILAILEALPCLTWAVPITLLREVAAGLSLENQIISQIEAPLPFLEEMPQSPLYCSMKELIHFLKTGQITGQMTAYLPTLTPQERWETIEKFLETNGKDAFQTRLLKLNLDFPNHLYIELLPDQKLLFCIINPKYTIRFVVLHESSIYEAFSDFFAYLGDPTNSYTVEETNQIIRYLMKKYIPYT